VSAFKSGSAAVMMMLNNKNIYDVKLINRMTLTITRVNTHGRLIQNFIKGGEPTLLPIFLHINAIATSKNMILTTKTSTDEFRLFILLPIELDFSISTTA
jgi:hypothetical protein